MQTDNPTVVLITPSVKGIIVLCIIITKTHHTVVKLKMNSLTYILLFTRIFIKKLGPSWNYYVMAWFLHHNFPLLNITSKLSDIDKISGLNLDTVNKRVHGCKEGAFHFPPSKTWVEINPLCAGGSRNLPSANNASSLIETRYFHLCRVKKPCFEKW